MSIEDRVGAIERETARHGSQIEQLSQNVREIGSGVKTLLDREARRPEPISLKVLAGMATGLAAIAVVAWWLIEHSPALVELRGRVTKIEWRLDNPASWSTTIVPKR